MAVFLSLSVPCVAARKVSCYFFRVSSFFFFSFLYVYMNVHQASHRTRGMGRAGAARASHLHKRKLWEEVQGGRGKVSDL